MLTKIIRFAGISLLILFSAVSIFVSFAGRDLSSYEWHKYLTYTSFFEDRFYDFRSTQTLSDKIHPEVVLAEIDDPSLQSIGRWPWSRKTWAEFIRKTKTLGVKVLAFDVIFSEPEVACSGASPDTLMADAIKDFQADGKSRVVLSYSLTDGRDEYFKELPDIMYNSIVDTKQAQGLNILPKYLRKSTFPIPKLLDSEANLAFIGAQDDPDGIFRHYEVLTNIDTLYFPSFALSAYQAFTQDPVVFEMLGIGNPSLQTKNGKISLNLNGETKVRWSGGIGSFPSISIQKILKAKDGDPELMKILNGRVVYIGSTAYAAHDLRHTPVDPMLPGVYFHMNLTQMLLDGYYFKDKNETAKYSWGMLVLGVVLISLVMFLGYAILDLFMVILITGTFYFIDTYYLIPQGHDNKLFFILFAIIATYSWNTFINFYLANKEKKQIKGAFSSYVAPAIVEQMLANPEMLKVGGEKKNITIFFSDVRDFTTISESLTPTQLSTCLNKYMGVMTDLLFENEGTLDKYIGDAIVAYWGAPIDVENHALKAVKTSIEMIEVLPSINVEFKELGYPEFRHGIGLNTGDCSVGNMGSDKIFSYTALGDSMNLGARLESLCKFYGVQLNVSEFTMAALPEDERNKLTYRILDKVRVKGKSEPITMYEVYHSFHHLMSDTKSHEDYLEAFECYQNMQFQQAVDLLQPIVDKYPIEDGKPLERASRHVLERCQKYLINPPAESWDGVYTHTTKG